MSSSVAASKVSAGVLIAITLWTFWSLQNSGPEAILRRFVEFAANQNWAELNANIAPSGEQLDNLPAGELFLIREAVHLGRLGSVRIIPRTRGPRQAIYSIQAEDPANGLITTTWVVTRPGINWTVDLRATSIAQGL